MLVYAILCVNKKTRCNMVSGECYTEYDDAVKFIETRSGNPVKVSDYHFDTDKISYFIKPLDVK